ncbi:hemin uptake protein HemP [Marichromatium bheemlicum]|uniref:Hemin uptake protein HemP n=1 Tax=Marichromatium bheemlicum TaxID=365339 RepID=A0ABX1I6Q8_9GAMM|nr:hemin uptake protein HemP [Marichromatium bheemlicum]NKN31905.1 hemin uptake protein HemP [Marichromatium bheemlicum]
MPSVPSTDSHRQGPLGRKGPAQLRSIDSRTLLGGQHLLLIDHAGERYFLRMTRNNKLILTK